MKLFYTDANKNKRLIAEDEDVMKIVEAAQADAATKFIHLKNLKLKCGDPELYTFMISDDEEFGYSVEE